MYTDDKEPVCHFRKKTCHFRNQSNIKCFTKHISLICYKLFIFLFNNLRYSDGHIAYFFVNDLKNCEYDP